MVRDSHLPSIVGLLHIKDGVGCQPVLAEVTGVADLLKAVLSVNSG